MVYAGNIGEGQGLEKIIPQTAKRLPNINFVIIGDGGSKKLLIDKINYLSLKNITLKKPVKEKSF